MVDMVRVLLPFVVALLEENDQLQATNKHKGTKLPPPRRTTSLFDKMTTTNPGYKVRPWDEQQTKFFLLFSFFLINYSKNSKTLFVCLVGNNLRSYFETQKRILCKPLSIP